MRLRPLLPAAAAALCLAASADASGAAFVPGEVIVRYEKTASEATRAGIERAVGIGRTRKLPGGSRELQIVDGETVAETLAELRADARVTWAVANHRARASFIPNDTGPGGPGDWREVQWNFFGPASINAAEAWDIASAAGAPGGRGALVAVLDTGVAYQNRGRFRRAPDLYHTRFVRGYDFVAEDRFPNDENGHGTHTTGTIAQKTHNRYGLTGLAYGVRIMPLRVLDSEGAGDAAAISRGIRFAARGGADVINMSLEFDASVTRAHIPEIVDSIRYAHDRGAVIVAAAGNEADATVAYPARTAHVISVAATTEHLCQADYSNTGPGLDVAAPGGGSDAPNRDNPSDAENCQPEAGGRDIYQQTFTRNVRTFGFPAGYQGTSMAAPHVSAAAALIVATRRLGPNPAPAAVEARLEETARDLGPPGRDSRYGAGLIDAAAAIAP